MKEGRYVDENGTMLGLAEQSSTPPICHKHMYIN